MADPKRPQVDRLLTVYDGQRMVGSIEEGATCIARGSAGELLGTFQNRKAAMKAVQAARANGGGGRDVLSQ
jgi:hypothetical protein